MNRTLAERFWEKVQKGDGCWEWLGEKARAGRGQILHEGRRIMAPRASWIVHYGADPGAMLVCHSCDNPGCVNPAHLWLGNESDNIQDALKKGRVHTGSRAKQAKLKESDVIEIRGLFGTLSLIAIARRYGVSDRTIRNIKDGETWNHIPSGEKP